MARPRLSEGGTERLHMVISAEEVTAIEDWRYRHRVPSKSEAIRRLCQIGITAERELTVVQKRAERAAKAMVMLLKKPDSQFAKAPKGLRAALVVALQEQVEATRAASAALIAAGILENGKDTAEVDELMKKVDVLLSVLREDLK